MHIRKDAPDPERRDSQSRKAENRLKSGLNFVWQSLGRVQFPRILWEENEETTREVLGNALN